MTTDAKVGLLLGLVFIVIIAFVINGLPDFVKTFKDKPVVETAVTTQTGGNLVIEPAVVDVARSLQQGHTNLRYTEAPSQTIALDTAAGSSQATDIQPQASSDMTPQPSFSNDVTAVNPQDNPSLVLPQVQQAQQSSQQRQTIPAEPLTPTRQAARDTVSLIEPVKLQPANPPQAIAGKSHVVGQGESLGAIAKKYYGSEVGNQRATIQMLYDANKSVLESPNKVKVGDKLIIPKIANADAKPADAVKPREAAKPKTETLMDKFKGVFVSSEKKDETAVKNTVIEEKPRVAVADKKVVEKKEEPAAKAIVVEEKPKISIADKKAADKTIVLPARTKTALMPATIDYTIQNGDNPYIIAKKFLGNGDRYPEIIAMNKDKLTNPSKLVVGTKIKVPKR